jgi:hypothetical protein
MKGEVPDAPISGKNPNVPSNPQSDNEKSFETPKNTFHVESLITRPFEEFDYLQFKTKNPRKPRPSFLSPTGQWVGYWRALNSFARKDPVSVDNKTYRVYFQFNNDDSWSAAWISRFEPEHPSYAIMSGKYSVAPGKMTLRVEGLTIKQRWVTGSGTLYDFQMVCDSCNWQKGRTLEIDYLIEDNQRMIFFDPPQDTYSFSERAYFMRERQ